MAEEWRDVPGYPGFKASSLGRILGKTGREVGCFKSKYVVIGMGYGKGAVNRCWMVAAAFLGPRPPDKPEVDHINRNKHDDRPENLRWANRYEQMANRDKLSHSGNNFKGVKLIESRQSSKKWRATLQFQKKVKCAYFETEAEAVAWLEEIKNKLWLLVEQE